jgi:polysaccharide biosynthesis protein PslJ
LPAPPEYMHLSRVELVPALALGLLCSAFALITGSVVANDGSFAVAAAATALAAGAALIQIRVVPWRALLAAVLLVVMFIPIRRYIIGIDGPFQLEPYRFLLGLILCGWIASLLVNPAVRLYPTGLEAPLAVVLLATLTSIALNGSRVSAASAEVVKSLAFFLSFLLVLYLLVSVVRTKREIDFLLRVLVGGGVVVALLAVVEARTGFTPFNGLSGYLPFMDLNPDFEAAVSRGARIRALGPAEHPIALGAALAMLIPPALYLARVGRRALWLGASLILFVACLATVSRTAILMIAAMVLFYAFIRPRAVIKRWPLLVVLVVLTHFVAPGTLGTLYEALTPEGGLVEQQRGAAGGTGSGRVADLGPSLEAWAEQPFFGQGFGTRVTTGPSANAFILDNQWLGTLLELGAVGIVGWAWLLLRVIRRAGGAALSASSATGDLTAALGAAVMGYAVGMFTFDAFSFIQVTLFMFLFVGLACVALRLAGPEQAPRLRATQIAQMERLAS